MKGEQASFTFKTQNTFSFTQKQDLHCGEFPHQLIGHLHFAPLTSKKLPRHGGPGCLAAVHNKW